MERLTLFADVIVPLGVPNKYTYRVPAELNGLVKAGKRVLVQFGKSRLYTGVIYAVHHQAPAAYEAKYIADVLDDLPVVNEIQLKFWDWIAFYYCANPGDVMNAALPAGFKLSSTATVQLDPAFSLEEASHSDFTTREHDVLEILQQSGGTTFDKLAEALKVKSAQPLVNKLMRKGAVVVYEDVKERYTPKLQSFVKLSDDYRSQEAMKQMLDTLEKKAFRQAEAVIGYLTRQTSGALIDGWMSKSELSKISEAGAINALVKKKVFKEETFETARLLHGSKTAPAKKLSEIQFGAYEQTKTAFNTSKPVLFHGVTGSGKTEVYIRLIEDAIESGGQALLLVPEIALTTQLISRLRTVFGDQVGVYHSRFSENERVEIWQNILGQNNQSRKLGDKADRYRVILGPRSALFLPFDRLGLVIVDEEHDSSYKQQDPAPRYHARDAAIYLASLHNARVVLGSATPSVESYHNALQEKYALVELRVQHISDGGTDAMLCDLSYFQNSNQMRATLTPPLFDAVQEALIRKRQAILFQNRRGFAPYTECKDCGHVPHCVQCDVALIYHKQQQKLVCHYCGYSMPPLQACNACGSLRLQFRGLGTEKIEEDIEVLFPDARIARMDFDTTRSRNAYSELIENFESGHTDILVGTQMVTKGLDFSHVTVVGVINADAMLNFPDFRAFERAFQVLTQVKGRAGRSAERGKVYIQTTQPAHPVLKFVMENNTADFFSTTLQERKTYNFPPFSRLIELNVVSTDANEVNHLSAELATLLQPSVAGKLLGPEFPIVSRIRNKYHKRILVKADRAQPLATVRNTIYEAIRQLNEKYRKWDFRVVIDVDPV
jgi:primosomal protein N' (replication factor Y) (superfamily II helicase)